MSTLDIERRSELAARLRQRKGSVAREVSKALLKSHPDAARSGEGAYERAVEDAEYHVEFLAAAVEAGSAGLFGNYLRWAGRLLDARGVPRALLIGNVHDVTTAVLAGEPVEAARLVIDIRDGALAILTQPEPELSAASGDSAELAASRDLLVDAALRGDRKAAFQVALDAFEKGVAVETLYIELFQRGMYEIGRRWEKDRLTVAQEHMGTATVQYVVAQLYARLRMPPPTRGKVVITGIEGEHHQLGANLVADSLEAAGFDVRFLGSNVPEITVLRAVEHERPLLVGISVTMPFNLPKAISLVRAIKGLRLDAPAPRILLGGGAFAATPNLAAELGILGIGHDVREAVALACSVAPDVVRRT
jgi:MerR family transcriptional regulator, light-induced transcriptional regulator